MGLSLGLCLSVCLHLSLRHLLLLKHLLLLQQVRRLRLLHEVGVRVGLHTRRGINIAGGGLKVKPNFRSRISRIGRSCDGSSVFSRRTRRGCRLK